ncbi:MAG: hypothetical protein R2883_00195 [Caldisericia bacterium]
MVSSQIHHSPQQYPDKHNTTRIYDTRNNDGLIKFNDRETEIVGTYDMATNTWLGGMIDAEHSRENGKYKIELTEENGGLIDEVRLILVDVAKTEDHFLEIM